MRVENLSVRSLMSMIGSAWLSDEMAPKKLKDAVSSNNKLCDRV
jgi:hypothetical protein